MENSLTSKRIKQTDWVLEFQEKPDETLNSLALQLISLLTLIFIVFPKHYYFAFSYVKIYFHVCFSVSFPGTEELRFKLISLSSSSFTENPSLGKLYLDELNTSQHKFFFQMERAARFIACVSCKYSTNISVTWIMYLCATKIIPWSEFRNLP